MSQINQVVPAAPPRSRLVPLLLTTGMIVAVGAFTLLASLELAR